MIRLLFVSVFILGAAFYGAFAARPGGAGAGAACADDTPDMANLKELFDEMKELSQYPRNLRSVRIRDVGECTSEDLNDIYRIYQKVKAQYEDMCPREGDKKKGIRGKFGQRNRVIKENTPDDKIKELAEIMNLFLEDLRSYKKEPLKNTQQLKERLGLCPPAQPRTSGQEPTRTRANQVVPCCTEPRLPTYKDVMKDAEFMKANPPPPYQAQGARPRQGCTRNNKGQQSTRTRANQVPPCPQSNDLPPSYAGICKGSPGGATGGRN